MYALISIHALLAESDVGQKRFLQKFAISIHALLAESDPAGGSGQDILNYFYPRSPCGERPDRKHQRQGVGGISIHALLAESDQGDPNPVPSDPDISIHALLAESDAKSSETAIS